MDKFKIIAEIIFRALASENIRLISRYFLERRNTKKVNILYPYVRKNKAYYWKSASNIVTQSLRFIGAITCFSVAAVILGRMIFIHKSFYPDALWSIAFMLTTGFFIDLGYSSLKFK